MDSATPMDIVAAGEEMLVSLYNWKQDKQLDSLATSISVKKLL